MHAYPNEFGALVRRRWNTRVEGQTFTDLPVYTKADPLPRPGLLSELLSTCYQASLLRDEDRPVRFRLLLCGPKALARRESLPEGMYWLPFVRPLPMAANALRRLAAAAAFERALIGAEIRSDGRMQIWGLVHSGDHWLRALEGTRRGFQPLPPCLVLSVTGPGNLSAAKGSQAVARLVGGQVAIPSASVLEVSPTGLDDEAIHQAILAVHAREQRRFGPGWARVDGTLVGHFRRQIASRIISAMRRLRHGGILLILPAAGARQRRDGRTMLDMQYAIPPGRPRRWMLDLLLGLLGALAADAGRRFGPSHRVTWRDYLTSADAAVHAADERVTEATRFLACLSAVDGAVVMRQPLELLGFGAEISGQLPAVRKVARALNASATRTRVESTLNVGTRHRSAYRICQAVPGAVAVVVSQDGSVRIMKRAGERVVYSEHLRTGVLDL